MSSERVPVQIFQDDKHACRTVAAEIAALIEANNARQKPTVLGLATGHTPVNVYAELIRRHRDQGLDLSRVITFNLDAYYPIDRSAIQSYYTWMHENLFKHVNIRPENIHIPRGDLPEEEVEAFCAEYERKIAAVGGIDLQILGIGRDGHIAFNEPGASLGSRTRLKTLTEETIKDNARFFQSMDEVPRFAITMGVGTILEARKILLLASGEQKAQIIAEAIEGPITSQVTASALQLHRDVVVIVDEAAGARLKRADYYRWVYNQKRRLIPTLLGQSN